MLGKRKRETFHASRSSKSLVQEQESVEGGQDAFRRFFEDAFAPLENTLQSRPTDYEDETEDLSNDNTQESDWSGFSDSRESPPEVEIIDYTNSEKKREGEELDHVFQKAFMSTKPPQQPKTQAGVAASRQPTDTAEEALNLKHDLELQRLLKESHLLEQPRVSSAPGRQRQKAIDLRLQQLGSKQSIFAQENMPMTHRKGIADKVATKDAARRKQARDNGVILERVVKKKAVQTKKRDRGLGEPSIGKFQHGTLKLSRGDLADIQGSNTAVKQGRRRGR